MVRVDSNYFFCNIKIFTDKYSEIKPLKHVKVEVWYRKAAIKIPSLQGSLSCHCHKENFPFPMDVNEIEIVPWFDGGRRRPTIYVQMEVYGSAAGGCSGSVAR